MPKKPAATMTAEEYRKRESEAAFQSWVIDMARVKGWRVCHFSDSRKDVGGGRLVGDKDAAGFPDLVMVRRGRLIFAELKSETRPVEQEQKDWLWDLNEVAVHTAFAVLSFTWRPSQRQEIASILDA